MEYKPVLVADYKWTIGSFDANGMFIDFEIGPFDNYEDASYEATMLQLRDYTQTQAVVAARQTYAELHPFCKGNTSECDGGCDTEDSFWSSELEEDEDTMGDCPPVLVLCCICGCLTSTDESRKIDVGKRVCPNCDDGYFSYYCP